MKPAHAYSREMGMTVRQAAEEHAKRHPLSAHTANTNEKAFLEWEITTDDPKIRDITDGMLDGFEDSMLRRGMTVATAQSWSNKVRFIVKLVRGGKEWIPHRGWSKPSPVPKRIDGTLRSYLHLSFFLLRLSGRSDAQKRNHEIALRHFERYLGRVARLKDLTNENVTATMQAVVDAGRSMRTANKTRDCLTALWRHLCQEGKVRKWPNVRAFPEPRRDPKAWTKGELLRLWRECETQPGLVGDVPAGLWWLALVSVLWNSAERIGAAKQLTWNNVDLETGYVRFPAETRKGKTADNTAKLHESTINLLRQFPPHSPDALVFVWPRSEATRYAHYKQILRRAGLSCGRDSKFHRVRKSAATWFEIAGHNATDLLQHSSRQVTKAYLDPRLIGTTHAADVLFDPSEPAAPPAPVVGKASGGGRESALMESGVTL